MSEQEKRSKAHCNSCGQETWHNVLADKVQRGAEETDGGYLYEWADRYELLECCGCENITFRRSGHVCDDPEGWVDYFPPAISRRRPDWLTAGLLGLEHPDIHSLMDEVYPALYANSFRLAMMGARTAIEMVMTDKLGEDGTFSERLKKLSTERLISTEEEDTLAAALEAGHAAVHRGHRPTAKEINDVMVIVEHLLHRMYVLGKAAERLKKATPSRKRQTP